MEASGREERGALFISHASPEDNQFVIWLGAKLEALGYEIWADVLRLRAGDDWQRKLEWALRNRAQKVLLVANSISVAKQGVRNEIQIATTVAQKIQDPKFIIPLRTGPFDPLFLIAHLQYIDFQRGWTAGLAELLATIDETHRVPRRPETEKGVWREIHLIHAKSVVQRPEQLVSNWLSVVRMPETIRLYDFKRFSSMRDPYRRFDDAPWQLVPYRYGFLSFAKKQDLQSHFGPISPIAEIGQLGTHVFLDSGWKKHEITVLDARRKFSDLVRQGLDRRFREMGLREYYFSGRQTGWWAPADIGPRGKVSFRWPGISGLRQIQGVSAKRNVNWHFAVSIAARSVPVRHVRVIGRLIFSIEGQTPLKSSSRVHRLRRSFAKSWRNARWRDMLLAFLWWLAEGRDELAVGMSSSESLALGLPPICWMAPVSMTPESEDGEVDDDDPTPDEIAEMDFEDSEEEPPETPDEEN